MNTKIKVGVLLLTIVLGASLLAREVIAQVYESNKVFTQVGDAPESEKPGGGNDNLVKSGIDLYNAYFQCSGGTRSSAANAFAPQCLKTQLTGSGYTEPVLTALEQRRRSAITSANCVECLGYVAMSLTLTTGSPQTLLSGIGSAAAVYNMAEFAAGSNIYGRISSQDIKPGDIGVGTGCEGIGANGHILIVKEVLGNVKFSGLESSFPTICYLTNDQKHNRDCYRFFRKKE